MVDEAWKQAIESEDHLQELAGAVRGVLMT
jgi:hypothetical protein